MHIAKKKNEKLGAILYWITLTSFIASLIYIPLRAIFSEEFRENVDYKLMLLQTILGLVVLNLPSILTKKFRWQIPNFLTALYNIFLWCAIFLGEVMDFYFRVPYWDTILHFMSSVMLGILGFSMIEILNNDKKHSLINLSPFFIAVFAVSFAILMGVLWEIYEFVFDGVFGLNMQKFQVESATPGVKYDPLVGREALRDTMEDLIIDLVGAICAATMGYISLKNRHEFIDAFRIEVFHTEAEEVGADKKPKHKKLFGKKNTDVEVLENTDTAAAAETTENAPNPDSETSQTPPDTSDNTETKETAENSAENTASENTETKEPEEDNDSNTNEKKSDKETTTV